MTFDDLVAVWRSQDEAPLHDVNRTLLHLALREDAAALRKERRRDRWMVYVFGVGCTIAMALFLAPIIYFGRATVWDVVLAGGGALAAFLTMRAVFLNHRTLVRREDGYGDSLRDQVNRRIAQLDNQATGGRRTDVLATVLLGGICPTAILALSWRINQKSVSDDGYLLVSLILMQVWVIGASIWELRRRVRNKVLPEKARLEALLKQLDMP